MTKLTFSSSKFNTGASSALKKLANIQQQQVWNRTVGSNIPDTQMCVALWLKSGNQYLPDHHNFNRANLEVRIQMTENVGKT